MTEISKADYLKKYLGGAGLDKKKKKKKDKISKESRFKIVETDAFATVAGNDYEDEDSDNDLEIQMINEAIKSKMKKGGMKGAFKSTFQTIDGPEIKEEPLDKEEFKKEPPQVKEEVEETSETKMAFKIAMKGSKSESLRNQSPPRRKRHDSPDQSPPRRRQRHDSDQSPPRTSTRQKAASPVRRKRHDSQSPPRRRQRHDSDNSPPRKRRQDTPDQSPPRRKRHDSDQSPPRQRRQRHDSDQSPPRNTRKRRDSDQSPPRKRRVASPEVDSKAKTLDGKTAGLQNARDLKSESDKIRAREAKMFDEMDAAVSGRDAETRVREKQTKRGRKGEDKEDKEKKEREARKQLELEEKYKEWNKGMRQMKERQEQLEEMARVVAGPMTRTAEDVDMNKFMKERIVEGDPMAAFIVKKKREEAIDRGDLVYPTYDKPFPPNRYGIRPGYRWDGVDRSNGFEGKLSLSQNARQAKEKEMYSNSNVFE